MLHQSQAKQLEVLAVLLNLVIDSLRVSRGMNGILSEANVKLSEPDSKAVLHEGILVIAEDPAYRDAELLVVAADVVELEVD